MTTIKNQVFDQERAFYGAQSLSLTDCAFDGEADGESACKESSDVSALRCFFNLRYPFWHCKGVTVKESTLSSLYRAPFWYSENITVKGTKLHGTKAFRECQNIVISSCDILSEECFWLSRRISVEDCAATGEYFMFRAADLTLRRLSFRGKYSFQYIQNALLEECELDTKDAFWHASNVTLRGCRIKGEYLAWYSENLTLEDCEIEGTQPFCYCKGLRLINCKMKNTDLCFEKSEVEATVTTPIDSVKNILLGAVRAPAVLEVIRDDPSYQGSVIIE